MVKSFFFLSLIRSIPKHCFQPVIDNERPRLQWGVV